MSGEEEMGASEMAVFEQDGERFSLEQFRAANADDPEVEEMVAALVALAPGAETAFAIGGGWGNPVRRVAE